MDPPCPAPLQAIVGLLEGLPESERREILIGYAAKADRHAPQPGERFDIEDVRHDAECTDTVGIHLRVDRGACHFRISFGPEIQTLTRALGAILCEGLSGAEAGAVAGVTETIIERIAGAPLVRLRSRTVYYMLHRMQEAVQRWQAPTG